MTKKLFMEVPDFDVKECVKAVLDQITDTNDLTYKIALDILAKTWEFVNSLQTGSLKAQRYIIIEQNKKIEDCEKFFEEHPEVRQMKRMLERYNKDE